MQLLDSRRARGFRRRGCENGLPGANSSLMERLHSAKGARPLFSNGSGAIGTQRCEHSFVQDELKSAQLCPHGDRLDRLRNLVFFRDAPRNDQFDLFSCRRTVHAETGRFNLWEEDKHQLPHSDCIFQSLQGSMMSPQLLGQVFIPWIGRSRQPIAFSFAPEQLEAEEFQGRARQFSESQMRLEHAKKIADVA